MSEIGNLGPRSVQPAGDDAVLPFEVEGLDVRGRVIQMGPALSSMLARHDYPLPVSKLLGEAIVLGVLLGSSLKFEGQFLLQTQTDGPVDMLVVDFRTPGNLRAYARFDAERVAEMEAEGTLEPAELLGNGVLAMTIDQGAHTSRYQGIVPLDGSSLEEVAHTYFAQSEQIPTAVRLAVAEMMTREDGKVAHSWRAGGLLVQFLPQSEDRMRQRDLPGGDAPGGLDEDDDDDDAWVEAKSLVSTTEDHELIDPEVPAERLLYRLFHERGVRVFDPTSVRDQCSCSRERIVGVLRSFSAEEITESIEDGAITVTCEFCGLKYTFDPAEFLS
ncbi:Hsp33 family molecular chaperone [Mesorhizobium sp. BR1-1-16]|uniref:Hsp33 family molecular chaperone n=1 Tax=Mesorhizobium sp. BR1-1-16 TaxID=2876653 RepID=UPI001CC91191|nr:Hsp33 family molecular chaperone [Mesorhizobium sp. BR1-1-16]MBZ9935925.1 Hsp33 family molecular chaperone [Mesorhizobium sp. BR1-1-16]